MKSKLPSRFLKNFKAINKQGIKIKHLPNAQSSYFLKYGYWKYNPSSESKIPCHAGTDQLLPGQRQAQTESSD
jgi:hypothetical protein